MSPVLVAIAVTLTFGVGVLSVYRHVAGYRIERHRQQRADQAAMYEFARTRRHLSETQGPDLGPAITTDGEEDGWLEGWPEGHPLHR